ncbi:hypothetical protein [Muricoccus nepalensis]|nr:hypothetical protein [Roseomonas nepalensis]
MIPPNNLTWGEITLAAIFALLSSATLLGVVFFAAVILGVVGV